MIIELQRQWVPEVSEESFASEACALCARELQDLSVVAYATTDAQAHIGNVCIGCIEFFGQRNRARFPKIEEYRTLLARYPEAMYRDMESLERAGEEAGFEDPCEVAVEAATVWSREEG